jgi:hypothetical protein
MGNSAGQPMSLKLIYLYLCSSMSGSVMHRHIDEGLRGAIQNDTAILEKYVRPQRKYVLKEDRSNFSKKKNDYKIHNKLIQL